MNLLDKLEAAIRRHGGDGEMTVSAPYRVAPDADVTVIARSKRWLATDEGRATIRALIEEPDTATMTERGRGLLVRFRDEPLALLGAELEAGAADALRTDDVAAGGEWVVDFCDPNATKALHVGHLRNLALGQALAGAAEAAGARVVRQSQVGDCGRSMGEALAGYLRFGGGRTPGAAGLKSDHFVGECYARYVASLKPMASAPSDGALSREAERYGDLAESLLARWHEGDEEVTALWREVRDWALEGQDATLARLGIFMDRTLLESDYLAETFAVAEDALAGEVATRADSGAVLYETGRKEYPLLLLTRTDGLPTQHLRYVALWRALAPALEGTRTIGVLGDEWAPMVSYGEEILRRVDPGAAVYPTGSVLHGMVTIGAGVVKSSDGEGLLVDDLLDALATSDEMDALRRENERVDSRELAAMVALGFCLGRPPSKRLTIRRDQLLSTRASAGWAMAQAWARSWSPRHDGDPDPDLEDSDYRRFVIQSQLHRRHLAVALERLDVFSLARFHAHLSECYLAAPPSARLARVMRTVLRSGLAALGLRGATAPGCSEGGGERQRTEVVDATLARARPPDAPEDSLLRS